MYQFTFIIRFSSYGYYMFRNTEETNNNLVCNIMSTKSLLSDKEKHTFQLVLSKVHTSQQLLLTHYLIVWNLWCKNSKIVRIKNTSKNCLVVSIFRHLQLGSSSISTGGPSTIPDYFM